MIRLSGHRGPREGLTVLVLLVVLGYVALSVVAALVAGCWLGVCGGSDAHSEPGAPDADRPQPWWTRSRPS